MKPGPRSEEAPDASRRKRDVLDALAVVEDIEDLPLEQQLARLGQAQATLAAVLDASNTLRPPQPELPGAPTPDRR